MTRDITLVCFDWGGVLMEVVPTWQEACRRAGLPVRLEHVVRAFSGVEGAGDRFQRGEIEYDAYCESVAARFAGTYTAAEVAAIHDAVLVGEYPGAASLIDELNRLPGVETALLSNTNAAHFAHVPRHAGSAAIRHAHASHLFKLAKPDPAIFRALERATGHAADAILFFDDLAANVQAARAAGWRAELVLPAIDPTVQLYRHLRDHGVLAAATPPAPPPP